MQELRKVVIIGPESTGKSSLCEQLATHYQTIWCREYARAYLLKHGTEYTYDSLLQIAKGQISLEDQAIEGASAKYRLSPEGTHPLIFIDTDMYVMKVWSEFVFKQCHPWIIDQIANRRYDLYLLCNTDLPWEKDALREYPDLVTRKKLYQIYKNIMHHQQTPWVEISGNYNERFETAKNAVEQLFEN